MPRVCTVCAHQERAGIDALLVAGTDSFRRIAAQFSVSATALRRHEKAHLPASLVLAEEAAAESRADGLLQQVCELRDRALGILDTAEGAGDLRTALGAIREIRECIVLLARLAGELREAPAVNIILLPEWFALRGAILGALVSFPEARLAVAEALNARGTT